MRREYRVIGLLLACLLFMGDFVIARDKDSMMWNERNLRITCFTDGLVSGVCLMLGYFEFLIWMREHNAGR